MITIAEKASNAKSYNNDYCLIVILDVKNASNTANWLNIVNALKPLKTLQYLVTIIQDYLSNEVLIYDTDIGPMQYSYTARTLRNIL